MPQLSDIVTFMQDTMQVNPMTVYCQFTGKPIGRMYQEEIESIIDDKMDVEEVADELLVRTLASMRPSVTWNVMRNDSLEQLRVKRPQETLAYLLNQLFQPADHLKVPVARRLNDLHGRIRLFHFLDKQPLWILGNLFQRLIEIDAKMNLNQQHIDLDADRFIANLDESLKTIDEWHKRCIERWTRNQRHEEDQRRWLKGATLARPAFHAAYQAAKPDSKTKVQKKAKAKEDGALAALFRSVMAEADSEHSANTVAKPKKPAMAVPATTTPKVVRSSTRIPSFLARKVKA